MGGCCTASQENNFDTTKQDSKLYRPVEYQSRIDDILNFWFKIESQSQSGEEYDRDTSLP